MLEILGPSQSCFYSSGTPVIYRTIGIIGPMPHELVYEFNRIINNIKKILQNYEDSILYWRRYPQLIDILDSNGKSSCVFKITCRIATYPDLPQEVWEYSYVKKEG